jgi:hypothetical protein
LAPAQVKIGSIINGLEGERASPASQPATFRSLVDISIGFNLSHLVPRVESLLLYNIFLEGAD